MAAPGRALEPEALTRKLRIDAALRESGWRIVPHLPGTPFSAYHQSAVTEFPTANGPADYALIANNRILAIVEAKRIGLAVQEVLTQAQRYSRGIQQLDHRSGEYGVPFLLSANGQTIRFLDVRDPANTARDLAKFPTPSALEELLARDPAAAFARLQSLANDNPRLRPYQREANDAVDSALAEGKRRMLVAMATGTGKTYTTVNQIYRLMKSGVASPLEQHQSPTPH
jgi:type I restriction enzyme R subunit